MAVGLEGQATAREGAKEVEKEVAGERTPTTCRDRTLHLGTHLAADAAACILAANAQRASTKPYARSAAYRDTSKAIAETLQWTTRRSANVAAKRDIPKTVPKTRTHATGARYECTRSTYATIHRDMYQKQNIY